MREKGRGGRGGAFSVLPPFRLHKRSNSRGSSPLSDRGAGRNIYNKIIFVDCEANGTEKDGVRNESRPRSSLEKR